MTEKTSIDHAPTTPPATPADVLAGLSPRLTAKIELSADGQHLVWTGATSGMVNRHRPDLTYGILAHRYAQRLVWEERFGEAPPPQLTARCGTKLCVLHWANPRAAWVDPSTRPRARISDSAFLRRMIRRLEARLTQNETTRRDPKL